MDKLREFKLIDTDHRAMLLVEGIQDALFCEALLEHLGESDKVLIIEARGRWNVPAVLKDISISNSVKDGKLLKLGILQDADLSAESSRTEVVDALRNTGLPVPVESTASQNGDTPIVSIFIAPDNHAQGSLEDLCLSSVAAGKVQCLMNILIVWVRRMMQTLNRILFPR